MNPNPLAWLAETVRITADGGVWFGDHQLPGCIAQGGVTLTPGGGQGINRLRVEFLVGHVITEDPTNSEQEQR